MNVGRHLSSKPQDLRNRNKISFVDSGNKENSVKTTVTGVIWKVFSWVECTPEALSS